MKRGQDKYGRVWNLSKSELCPVCGQPDNCGDCDHKKIPAKDVTFLGGVNFARSCPCREIDNGTGPCEECYKNVWRERRNRCR